MVKYFFLSLFLTGIFSSAIAAGIIPVEQSELKEVEVFFKGAQFIRNFSVQIPSGRTEIKVFNLSSQLDEHSLVLNLPSPVRIISLYHQVDYENRTKKDLFSIKISDSISSLQLKIKNLIFQQEALDNEKKSLIDNSTRIGTAQGISLTELDQTLVYMRRKQEEINQQWLVREQEKNNFQLQLNKLSKRKAALDSSNKALASVVTIIVESVTAIKADVKLSYYVSGCGWAPTYNIYTKGIDNPLDIEYKAKVLNNSGEYWDDVKLTLIAGNPSRSLTVPVLETWELSYSYRKKNGRVISSSDGNEGRLSKKQIKGSAESVEYQQIEMEEGQLLFETQGLYTIPSENREYLVDVQKYVVSANYHYQTVPKIDAKAYLIAQIKDWEELKLIEGDANIFMNNTFIGRTYLDPLSAGDTLELSLGSDPNIQITRVKKKDFSSKKFIGLQLVESFSYEIDVRNLNIRAVFIEVIDQVPLAMQSEIQVRIDEKDGATHTEGNGKLVWRLDIPSQQTVKLKMGYTVHYPKDKVVIMKRTGKVMCPRFR